jgi:hypothetical protein
MDYVFVQYSTFVAKAKKMGFTAEDVRRIELAIMEGAQAAPVVAGTGGLRKIRFAPEASGAGKSGGVRVCYVVLEEVRYFYLLTLFAKNEKDNLEKSERNAIASLIVRIKNAHKRQE